MTEGTAAKEASRVEMVLEFLVSPACPDLLDGSYISQTTVKATLLQAEREYKVRLVMQVSQAPGGQRATEETRDHQDME